MFDVITAPAYALHTNNTDDLYYKYHVVPNAYPTCSQLSPQQVENRTLVLAQNIRMINGYMAPPLVIFTLFTNIIICVVLLKPHMRSPTNAMLVAMALSDMMTGLVALPPYLYFYTYGASEERVPFHWCYLYDVLCDHLPTLFHTASIWLTVALAAQVSLRTAEVIDRRLAYLARRYICICHSTLVNRWISIRNVVIASLLIYLAACLSQFTRFFEKTYTKIQAPSLLDRNVMVTTCCMDHVPMLANHLNTYFNIYYWFRILFIHLASCTSLVALNAILIYVMKQAQKRRHTLLMLNRKTECKRLKDKNSTTYMLVIVVAVFLIVEFPLAIILILFTIENTFQVKLIPNGFETIPMYINFCITLSYPLNFFIYCRMSKQFRDTFKRLFFRGDLSSLPSLQGPASHYQTIATDINASAVGGASANNQNDTVL